MRVLVIASVIVSGLVIVGDGRAETVRPPDLTVRRMPTPIPTTLAMRQEVGAAAAPAAPAAPERKRGAAVQEARRETVAPGERLEDKVIFRFNIGFGMDGGQPSDQQPLVGGELSRDEYDVLRPYGFGDVAAGTRGLLMSSLSTYFAAEFRIDQNLPHAGEGTGAVPSVYAKTNDDEEMLIRHGYAEVEGLFERPWLRPLTLRAGRQFKYSVTVTHFDGVTWSYETRPVTVSLWTGNRVSLYHLNDQIDQDSAIGGGNARVDFFELKRFPLVLTYDWLTFDDVDHSSYAVAFRWGPDLLIRGTLRSFDGEWARETLAAWWRYSEVTTLNVEIDNRGADDWMYDLMAPRPVDRRGDPRSYLNMGPVLPRLQLAVRGGTVLLRNLDILLRGAAAIEHAGQDELGNEIDGPFTPSYVEAGTALEVRLRRNLRLGASFTARRYRRDDRVVIDETTTPGGTPLPLADPLPPELGGRVGERSFYESGLGVDYTAGARRFNASAELYSRAYDRQTQYEQTVLAGKFDVHSGGRFAVEGWARNRLRMKAEYDVSLGALEMAPELRGVKMLRVLMEATF